MLTRLQDSRASVGGDSMGSVFCRPDFVGVNKSGGHRMAADKEDLI